MKRVLFSALITCFALATAPVVWGDAFYRPPENNTNITWQTEDPYQRNIMMDFSEDPVGATGPIPGADYEGYDDPYLWDSDFVTIDGDIEWNEEVGGIGIFGNGEGTITFHFDNWERDWPVKHFYEELIFQVEIATCEIWQDFVTPDGMNTYTDSWDKVDSLGGGKYRLTIWTEFQPNPSWEEKVILLRSLNGGNIYIDSLHIATECVPTPTAVILGILGLGAVGIKLRKYA